ncbi:MAG: hypothetical protein WD825_17385 [Gemmatimonadaceae bacterium]
MTTTLLYQRGPLGAPRLRVVRDGQIVDPCYWLYRKNATLSESITKGWFKRLWSREEHWN